MKKGKIFGIGLPKTGTSSLHAALQMLGYSSVHFPTNDQEIANNDASSDITVAARFEELDSLYPGSKFILTVREVTSWLQSCEQHFGRKLDPSQIPPQLRQFLGGLRMKVFGTISYDRTLFERAHYNHEQQVKRYFANRPNDLLVTNIIAGEGWEKLCPFLDRPIPAQAFPRENVACESVDDMVQKAVEKGVGASA